MKNPNFVSGWSYMGFGRMSNLQKDIREKITEVGDSFTIKLDDRYLMYRNTGSTIGAGDNNRPLYEWHRRFRKLESINSDKLRSSEVEP